MHRAAVLMLLVGGVVGSIGVLTTERTMTSRRGHGACAAVLIVCGLFLLVTPAKRSRIIAAVMVGVADLGVLVMVSDPLGTAPMFFLWPLVFCAYFVDRRTLSIVFVFMSGVVVAAVSLNPRVDSRVDLILGVVSSVGVMAGLVNVMTQREQHLRFELHVAASTDPLTELMNRRSFDPRLEAMLVEATSTWSSLAVVMFDLDHFKQFNDEHGHLVGDVALQRFADVLREQSRDGDAVSRFGGEEFAVAMCHGSVDAAHGYAARVARALATHPDQRLRLAASAGISTSDVGDRARDMLDRADAALYAAKNAGRARVAFWNGDGFTSWLLPQPQS